MLFWKVKNSVDLKSICHMFWRIVSGVMQATVCSGSKLEKRYSPSFQDDQVRLKLDRKRKRGDDVLK